MQHFERFFFCCFSYEEECTSFLVITTRKKRKRKIPWICVLLLTFTLHQQLAQSNKKPDNFMNLCCTFVGTSHCVDCIHYTNSIKGLYHSSACMPLEMQNPTLLCVCVGFWASFYFDYSNKMQNVFLTILVAAFIRFLSSTLYATVT